MPPETPEQKARQKIDAQLIQCGWQVQNLRDINIAAGPGVAVREFALKSGHGEADYLLYVDGQAVGVVEAKPEGHSLLGVETQSRKYTDGLPAYVPAYRLPLPFAYESTGVVTQFTNSLEPHARSREVFAFHRPEELRRLVELPRQLREGLRSLPPLPTLGLRDAQIAAIQHLEKSLSENRPRALIQMATGSGKTYTAVSSTYRLIKYGGARRVLFLVDRNNLGKQALTEFQQFDKTTSGRKFTEEYNVQHLTSNTLDPVCNVCITTVQRLYSMLRGEADLPAEFDEERSMWEDEPKVKAPVSVVYNAAIPPEFFDFIIVDECHRSIYNLWRQVLEYFDAFLIGLTATPTKQTAGYFDSNLVMEYGHEQAVADGVNVGFEVYRIKTKISERDAPSKPKAAFSCRTAIVKRAKIGWPHLITTSLTRRSSLTAKSFPKGRFASSFAPSATASLRKSFRAAPKSRKLWSSPKTIRTPTTSRASSAKSSARATTFARRSLIAQRAKRPTNCSPRSAIRMSRASPSAWT